MFCGKFGLYLCLAAEEKFQIVENIAIMMYAWLTCMKTTRFLKEISKNISDCKAYLAAGILRVFSYAKQEQRVYLGGRSTFLI